MSSEPVAHSKTEVVSGASVGLVGAGVVTVALFPLALPIILLTAAATVPLLVPALAAGLVLAVVAVPILLLRRVRRPRRGSRPADRGRAGAAATPPARPRPAS